MNLTTMVLNKIKNDYQAWQSGVSHRIVVCAGTGCLVNGSLKVYDEFLNSIRKSGLHAVVELEKEEGGLFVSKSGCQGFCQIGPLVTILPDNILYKKVKPGDVKEIVETTLKKGELVHRLLYMEPATKKVCRGMDDIPFYRNQNRFVLKNCGVIDPENINEYIASGGYQAATEVCGEMTPEAVCDYDGGLGTYGAGEAEVSRQARNGTQPGLKRARRNT